MKDIVIIAFGSDKSDFEKEVSFYDVKYRISRFGVNGNIEVARKLIEHFDGNVDVMAMSGFPDSKKFGKSTIHRNDIKKLSKLSRVTPIVTGNKIRNMLIPWSLSTILEGHQDLLTNKSVAIFSGVVQSEMCEHLPKSIIKEAYFGDMYFFNKVPVAIKGPVYVELLLKTLKSHLEKVATGDFALADFSKTDLVFQAGMKKFLEADVFVLYEGLLSLINLPRLDNKTILIDTCSLETEIKLKALGAKVIISCLPKKLASEGLSYSTLEAMLMAQSDELRTINEEDVMKFLESKKIRPEFEVQPETHKKRRFAFVIHPLSKNDLMRLPYLRPFKRIKAVNLLAEKAFSKAPGFLYGRISGIKSEYSGVEIEGDIYGVLDTPKMLLQQDADVVYKKLHKITVNASKRGNVLIGLGAYTKIVGDAGVTVNDWSPIPVTTGNSLSAASTLWAADFAVRKMGMIPIIENQFQGTVIIVGATGSIGKVSAMLLAQNWQRIIIVAPKIYKLVDLADRIKKLNPTKEILYTTNADKYLNEASLIITSTSNFGQKLLDIKEVRPGAVICDVSRPFDISKEEAVSRPDVLVIASGEVELPGKIDLNCDLGLEGNVVYACLAETAVLTLENKIESFSLSRDLSYEKVKEIDRLSRKHGVRLAAIMGHDHEITENEIALCRSRAVVELSKKSGQVTDKTNNIKTLFT